MIVKFLETEMDVSVDPRKTALPIINKDRVRHGTGHTQEYIHIYIIRTSSYQDFRGCRRFTP